jgi:HSP20 family molecular chaperone IbpA
MLFLVRILIFLLALYLLWRLLRELYVSFRERVPIGGKGGRVVEPRVESLRRGNREVVRIYLPGVASERDISLRVLTESIEVRARSAKESFFKIIPKDAKNRVRARKFKPPVLEIEIE